MGAQGSNPIGADGTQPAMSSGLANGVNHDAGKARDWAVLGGLATSKGFVL